MLRSLAPVMLFAACASESEEPFVAKYESERLRIGTTFDSVLCLGHGDMWEEHLSLVEQTLGVSRDFAWLFLYGDDEQHKISADCGRDPSMTLPGCWKESVARSTLEYVPHELVHAWTATVQPRSLPILAEGIAVALSGVVQNVGTQEFTADDLLLAEVPGWLYPKVGHFVGWVLATYGPETFMALHVKAKRGMTKAEVAAVFMDTLGSSPEEVLRAYESSAKAYYPARGGAACGQGPAIAWQDDAATWPAVGSCEDGPFFGFEDSNWWQRVTIEVLTPGMYLLDLDGRLATMTRCLTAPANELELPTLQADGVTGDWLYPDSFGALTNPYDDWDEVPLALEAGTYEVWVERTREVPGLRGGMGLFKL